MAHTISGKKMAIMIKPINNHTALIEGLEGCGQFLCSPLQYLANCNSKRYLQFKQGGKWGIVDTQEGKVICSGLLAIRYIEGQQQLQTTSRAWLLRFIPYRRNGVIDLPN